MKKITLPLLLAATAYFLPAHSAHAQTKPLNPGFIGVHCSNFGSVELDAVVQLEARQLSDGSVDYYGDATVGTIGTTRASVEFGAVRKGAKFSMSAARVVLTGVGGIRGEATMYYADLGLPREKIGRLFSLSTIGHTINLQNQSTGFVELECDFKDLKLPRRVR